MKLKGILLTAASCVLTAAIAVGGTLAYLQSDDSDVNVMTTGKVSIDQIELQRADGVAYNAGESGKGNGVKEGALVPFVQNQKIYPAVPTGNGAYTAEQTDLFYWGDYVYSGTAGNGLWNDNKLANVMDKMIFVKNTGKSDAYVRTIIALECPEGMEFSEGADKEFMVNVNGSKTAYTWDEIGYITVDGVRYIVKEATYLKVLNPGNTSHPSLLQVVMTHNATNEDMELLGDTYEILAVSQAVQADGFKDANTALDAAFGDITTTQHPWVDAAQTSVSNDADLKAALQDDATTIIVNLTDDVTYDVAAWQVDAMGGEKTEKIVINGNGHTITFNQTDSDWTNIVTNGAKLIINNATITNSGYDATSGTWNGHDITFNCEVELNNVTSLNAIALEDNAELNSVNITDDSTGDAYMLWISAKAENVSLNGCVIDATGTAGNDRGIKIANEYVEGEEVLVNLTVKNTKFITEKKAAILVYNPAGANIVLDNVDISGVKADPINAVWVDEGAAAYADKVTVTGGNKIIEGEVAVVGATNKADLKNNLADAIADGETNIIVNAEGADIGDLKYGLNTSLVPAGTTVTIANANTKGWNYGNAVAGTVVFDNCTFDSDSAYSIHFDAGGGNVVFNNCTLNGWASFGTAIKSVEMNNCTINGNGVYAIVRCYQDATLTNCTIDSSNTNTTDIYQDGIDIVEGYTMTLVNCTNVNGTVAELFEDADINGTDGTVIIK